MTSEEKSRQSALYLTQGAMSQCIDLLHSLNTIRINLESNEFTKVPTIPIGLNDIIRRLQCDIVDYTLIKKTNRNLKK